MDDVEDEPLFCERVAGIDIGKTEVMVTIRVPSDTRRGRRQQETRAFRAVRKDLVALADWLRSWGVTKVGMEATGDYWKPVYFLLEREGFDCVLYHAAQVKALPGRPKTSWTRCGWRRSPSGARCRAASCPRRTSGGCAPIPATAGTWSRPAPPRRRCEKLLEDAHLKLSSVITDIHGVSGREMLTAVIAGQRNPKVLAQMARTRMRGKIRQLEDALDCSFFTEQHAFILQMMLANIDHLTAQVSELTVRIEVLCEPYARQIAQLDAIPGFGVITAQDIIAETGVDMTVFPTAGHLCSWARQAPQVSQSAGKRKGKNATGRGNPYIAGALGEAAVNAGRTQTFPGAKYRRLCKQMPKKKAQGAISRTQLVICHALLSDPDAVYTDLGTDYYERRQDIRRRARNHVRGLERLGYKVTIQAINPDTGELLAAAG